MEYFNKSDDTPDLRQRKTILRLAQQSLEDFSYLDAVQARTSVKKKLHEIMGIVHQKPTDNKYWCEEMGCWVSVHYDTDTKECHWFLDTNPVASDNENEEQS